MTIRPTQSGVFDLVRRGILSNSAKLIRAQEQLASGRRLLRPSDDAVATSLSLAFRRQLARSDRFVESIGDARFLLDAGAAAVEDAGGLMAQARATLLQGMNGTSSDTDRRLLASEIEGIRAQLLDLANRQVGDRFLFSGTASDTQPFQSLSTAGQEVALYSGNDDNQRVVVGVGSTAVSNIPGSEVFAKRQPGVSSYAGLTGAASGATVDQGSGYDYLEIRHETTTGTLGAGVTFVAAGAGDTIMGDRTLVVDGVAGTVQLGNGPVVDIPQPTDLDVADFIVEDSLGATLHLDFAAYTGGDIPGATVTGGGSASLDGVNYVSIDFVDQDLQLVDSVTGSVLHVDTTGIGRAGQELVTFGGTVNVFDVLQGIADDLNNVHGLDNEAVIARLGERLVELDRNHQNALQAVGVLGARSASLTSMESRLEDAAVQIQDLLSRQEDADVGQVVLDLASAEQTLQLAQAAGVRLLQNTLLNFLN